MIPSKFSAMSILLIIALLVSTFAVVAPAAPVKAATTGIEITSPTATTPQVVKPGTTMTVTYNLLGDTDTEDVFIEVYSGTSVIAAYTDSGRLAGGGPYTTAPFMVSNGAAQGTYTLKATTVTSLFSDTELGAVIVDNTPPVVTISTPNVNTCWASGTVQNIQWSVSDAASTDNVTLTAEYSIDGAANWLPIFSRSNRQGADQFAWTVPAASQPGSYVRFTATDKAGNAT